MNLLNITIADIAQVVISVILIVVTIYLGKQSKELTKEANKISGKSIKLDELSYKQQKEIQDTQIKLTLFDKRYEVYKYLTKDIFDNNIANEENIEKNKWICEDFLNSVDFLFNKPESESIKVKINMICFALDGFLHDEPLKDEKLEQEAQDEYLFGGYDIRFARVLIKVANDCGTLFYPYLKLS